MDSFIRHKDMSKKEEKGKGFMNILSPQIRKFQPVMLVCLVILVSACEQPTCSDTSLEAARGPYLQNMSSTSIVVKWRSQERTTSRLRYGASPQELFELQEK